MNKPLALFALLFPLILQAQNIEVTGQLRDGDDQPLSYATVTFTHATDSTFSGTVSDEDGGFKVAVLPANYDVSISFVGMEPQNLQVDLSNETDAYDLGVISVSTAVSLEEIVVSGNKATLKLDVDKKTYNVAQDLLARGGTLSDVMQSLPSVQVEADGSVSIRGNANVLILVDGRPSGLASTAQLYSTIPASTIERVEVITNPSSKYFAQGAGGIINVVIRKGQKSRSSSSLEIFTGYRPLAGLNGNFSKSGQNGSWFANGGIGYSEPQATTDVFLQSPGNMPDVNNTTSDRIRKQRYYLINLGGTKSFGERSSLNGNLTYRGARSDNVGTTFYEDFVDNELILRSDREEEKKEENSFLNTNLSFTHDFGQEGHRINLFASGEFSTNDDFADIISSELRPNPGTISQDISRNKEDVRRYAAAFDYELPIKNYALELGYRGDFAKIENDFAVERLFDEFVTIPDFTDQTSYGENIHAFYGQVGRNFEKLSFKLGLRAEYTDVDVFSSEINVPKDYTNLFPSAFVRYTFDEKNQLQLSASRRVNRPASWMIVPFTTFTDERNIFVGNIDLDPSFITAAELGYKVILSDQLTFSPTLYYRITQDELEFFVEKQQFTIGGVTQDIFVSTMANIGVYETYGTELAATYDPFGWWSLYGELILNGFNQRGSVRGASFDGDGVLVSTRLNSTFSLFKSTKLQIQNYYKGPIETGQYKRIGYYWLSAGLSTTIFGDKGTLSFNVRDVFNSNRRVITTFGPDFTREIDLQYRVRQMTLSFTYLFNQQKNKGRKGNQFDRIEILN